MWAHFGKQSLPLPSPQKVASPPLCKGRSLSPEWLMNFDVISDECVRWLPSWPVKIWFTVDTWARHIARVRVRSLPHPWQVSVIWEVDVGHGTCIFEGAGCPPLTQGRREILAFNFASYIATIMGRNIWVAKGVEVGVKSVLRKRQTHCLSSLPPQRALMRNSLCA